MPITPFRRLTVVTGVSHGIGLELVKQFAQSDFDLLIGAENNNLPRASHMREGFTYDVLPESLKANRHRAMAEPGSGAKA